MISPRFADIFRNNCHQERPGARCRSRPRSSSGCCEAVEADPSLEITVDVERRVVEVAALGIEAPFPLDDSTQQRFLEGLDDIGLTLDHAAEIDAYEAAARPGSRRSPSGAVWRARHRVRMSLAPCGAKAKHPR